ncbi:MAG: hypothetical protein LC793_07060 [Thermomicrobia bacterium]|nr:hypothetical protein [Thermomicrobia bacterium]
MPIQSSTLLRDTANVVGPGTVLADNGYGTLVATSATDVVKFSNIKIGLFAMSATRQWIRSFGGGPENTRDWQVAVPGRYAITYGQAFVVPAGNNPGKYRIKEITKGITRSSLTLCICNKEL